MRQVRIAGKAEKDSIQPARSAAMPLSWKIAGTQVSAA